MRTLSSVLCQPMPDTAETTKPGAMGTQTCVLQLLHTNETSSAMLSTLSSSIASGSRWGPLLPPQSVVRFKCLPEIPRSNRSVQPPEVLIWELRQRPPHLRSPLLQVRRQLDPLNHFYSASLVGVQAVASGRLLACPLSRLPATTSKPRST